MLHTSAAHVPLAQRCVLEHTRSLVQLRGTFVSRQVPLRLLLLVTLSPLLLLLTSRASHGGGRYCPVRTPSARARGAALLLPAPLGKCGQGAAAALALLADKMARVRLTKHGTARQRPLLHVQPAGQSAVDRQGGTTQWPVQHTIPSGHGVSGQGGRMHTPPDWM